MYCKNCGEMIPDGTRFCSKCGSRVDENSDVANSNKIKNDLVSYMNNLDKNSIIRYSKLAFLISSILAIMSTFLPYIKASAFGFSMSINFIRISGKLAGGAKFLDGIILIVLAIVAIYLWKKDLKRGMLIVGAISSIFMIYEIFKISKVMDEMGIIAHAGLGFYLCCISSFIMFASSFIYYRETTKN